jgi:hypothetical protein
VKPHRPNFFNTRVQGLKGSKIDNNRWIAFLWTFDPLNLCVEKSLAYKSQAVEKRYESPAYLHDPARRELFRLAHMHGVLLNLLFLAAALCSQWRMPPPPASCASRRSVLE